MRYAMWVLACGIACVPSIAKAAPNTTNAAKIAKSTHYQKAVRTLGIYRVRAKRIQRKARQKGRKAKVQATRLRAASKRSLKLMRQMRKWNRIFNEKITTASRAKKTAKKAWIHKGKRLQESANRALQTLQKHNKVLLAHVNKGKYLRGRLKKLKRSFKDKEKSMADYVRRVDQFSSVGWRKVLEPFNAAIADVTAATKDLASHSQTGNALAKTTKRKEAKSRLKIKAFKRIALGGN